MSKLPSLQLSKLYKHRKTTEDNLDKIMKTEPNRVGSTTDLTKLSLEFQQLTGVFEKTLGSTKTSSLPYLHYDDLKFFSTYSKTNILTDSVNYENSLEMLNQISPRNKYPSIGELTQPLLSSPRHHKIHSVNNIYTPKFVSPPQSKNLQNKTQETLKKNSQLSFSESVKNYTDAISRIYNTKDKKRPIITNKQAQSTSIENGIQTELTPRNQNQNDKFVYLHRKVNSVVIKNSNEKIECSPRMLEPIYERKQGINNKEKLNVYKSKTLVSLKETRKSNQTRKSLSKTKLEENQENRNVENYHRSGSENKIKINEKASSEKSSKALSNVNHLLQANTQSFGPKEEDEFRNSEKEQSHLLAEKNLSISMKNNPQIKNEEQIETHSEALEKAEGIPPLIDPNEKSREIQLHKKLLKKRISLSCVYFTTNVTLFPEFNFRNTSNTKRIQKVSGDIVSPFIQKKMRLIKKENSLSKLKKMKSLDEENKESIEQNPFFKKFQFKHKTPNISFKKIKHPQIQSDTPKSKTSSPLEKDFLKTFDQILSGNLPFSNTPRNRRTLEKSQSSFSNMHKMITLKNLCSLDPLQYEDFFKDDLLETIPHLDQDVSLESSQVSETTQAQSTSTRPKLLRSMLSVNPLSKTKTMNNNAMIIEIIPPIETGTFAIEEAYADLEESCGNSSSLKSLGKLNTNRTVRQTYDVPYRSETMSNFSGILKNVRETSSLQNSGVENNKNISQLFKSRAEDIFQFDQIFPSYFSNLNANAQKLRIKANFFSFIEKIIEPSILNSENINQTEDESTQNLFNVEKNKTRRLFYPLIKEIGYEMNPKLYDEILTQEEISDLILLFEQSPQRKRKENDIFISDEVSEEIKAEKNELALSNNEILFQRTYPYKNSLEISQRITQVPLLAFFAFKELNALTHPEDIIALRQLLFVQDDSETLAEKHAKMCRAIASFNEGNFSFLKKGIMSCYGELLEGIYENTIKIDDKRFSKQNEKLRETRITLQVFIFHY